MQNNRIRRGALRTGERPTSVVRRGASRRKTRSIVLQLNRRGLTLFEMVVTGVLLGGMSSLVIPTLRWITHEHRETQRHQQALAAAANIIETLVAQPWESVTAESVAKTELPATLREQLPGAELKVVLKTTPDAADAKQTAAKQITVELRWQDQAGQLAAPLRLSAWMHRERRAGA